jgi:acetoin utilization deacetylase AcuC-like enzyme
MFFVYSDSYYADMLGHVFTTDRYHLLYQRLIEEGLANAHNTLPPRPATVEELALVHTKSYLDDILNCRYTPATISSEIPLSEEIVSAFALVTGGTIVAAEKAMEEDGVMNVGGGFHHAFPDHAEGFCLFNDIAVAIRSLRQKKYEKKILVVDCDLHQGNGTAFIFRDDPSVFTFSIHQENNYPVKQKSDLDIGLEDGTGDEDYLFLLETHIPRIIENETPSLMFYVAGGDPYIHDQLGGLSLTMEGLFARDRLVLSYAKEAGCGVVIVLAGGYAQKPEDTVQIHFQTACALREVFAASS